jgi:hypothetical protein
MKIKLELDDKRLKAGFADFPKANAEAVKNTLNVAAALTRRNAITNVKNDFTLRNTFTTRNIQFDKATLSGTSIKNMESRVGATERADYMATQEDSGKRKLSKKSSGNTAIPQTSTRIGRSSSKMVSKALYLRSMRSKMVKGRMRKNFKSPKARVVARMYVANRENKFFKRSDGSILRVKQFSKSGKNTVTARTELLYTLIKRPIFIRQNKWLEPATKKPARDLDNIYKSNLRKLWKTGKFD